MSRMRAILDRINDVESTILKIEQAQSGTPTLATELSLRSLEGRRENLTAELSEITRTGLIDVCDYKIIPDSLHSYAISAVTAALHDFQDLVSIVFASLVSGPRRSAKISADVAQKTEFGFGFAYSGSLGVVLTIPNDRLIGGMESELDRAVSEVFALLRIRNSKAVNEAATRLGVPVVKKLHHWTKTHSQYGMSADIKWTREEEIRDRVVAQSREMELIYKLIEESDKRISDPIELTGELVAWSVPRRTFVLTFPDSPPISGHWSKTFNGQAQRKVPSRYRARLTKETLVRYGDGDIETWTLDELIDMVDTD
ncbi:hypothetical protein X770_02885 [Mesorhizobium sp. LSJC269B00]|uniref:hypothetical protein n=1 Tax=Mesorhizobium sp. LSJC269B00 TaxID=1287326 RepID=UPI0003CF4AC2|nr:hypothetical protein [Mesorhizobium sp. LSJC269B00]ESW93865.1 hypothetical protein X770_02885 [Mesorhizobium sp. LSJC269B00]